MKPQTVLKIDPIGKTQKDIYDVRDVWIKEYQKYVKENPVHYELGEILIDRVKRAAEMLVLRYVGKDIKHEDVMKADEEFHCDDYRLEYKEEDASLEGSFPLGNAYDADFAVNYFTVEQLVKIQFGETYTVPTGHYVEPAYDVLVRKGFICELEREWADAERYYRGGGMSKSVFRRETDCKRKKNAEGELCYGMAQRHMESGEWSKVYGPLSKAVRMENTDAMTDMGLARIYGTFGIRTDYDEGLELLRAAARENNARACMEIVELYDNGSSDIEGEEAARLCKKAAELGDARAAVRLEDGFDTRPLLEILSEQASKGNSDAMWWLYNSALKINNSDEARHWYEKALEAGQNDALICEAKKYLDKESASYNRELAERYLRRAVEKGSVKAILELSALELKDGDESFWITAMKKEREDISVDSELFSRHKKQFAWTKLASEAEDTASIYRIAIAYRFGYPVEEDHSEAFRLAEMASSDKDPSAMFLAGGLLEKGMGVERDIDRAISYYEASAEKGIVPAMLRLYEIYSSGLEHIQADKEKAERYLWMTGIGHS